MRKFNSTLYTLSVDDATALRMIAFYPEWESGKAYTSASGCPVGYKATRNDRLWKLRQEHTPQDNWAPGETGTESLWEEICESHDGAWINSNRIEQFLIDENDEV